MGYKNPGLDRVEIAKALLLLKTHTEQSCSSQRINPVTSITVSGIL
jgi:hypothetical protein